MTAWYYAAGEDKRGPVGEDEMLRLIKTGQITRETNVWHEGMDAWQKAVEHPDLSSAFSMPPPLPSDPSPQLTPPDFEPSVARPGIAIASRPWPRFFARSIDNLVLLPLLGIGIGLWSVLYAPNIYLQIIRMNAFVFGMFLLPIVALLLALCMTIVGTTPGKAIIGVRVPVPQGHNRITFFLSREFKVWFFGLGLGIPLVTLFTQIRQCNLLLKGKSTSYDEGNPEIIGTPSKMRLAAGILVFAILFAGNIILKIADQSTEINLITTQNWLNPVTNKTGTIGKTWQAKEMETNSGRLFYFNSSELLAEAIFGYEQLPHDGVQTLTYANAIKEAIASSVSIDSEWRPATVGGMPALKATAKSIKYPDRIVEVTISVKGRDAWRAVVFTRVKSPTQATENEKFLQAVFGTTN